MPRTRRPRRGCALPRRRCAERWAARCAQLREPWPETCRVERLPVPLDVAESGQVLDHFRDEPGRGQMPAQRGEVDQFGDREVRPDPRQYLIAVFPERLLAAQPVRSQKAPSRTQDPSAFAIEARLVGGVVRGLDCVYAIKCGIREGHRRRVDLQKGRAIVESLLRRVSPRAFDVAGDEVDAGDMGPGVARDRQRDSAGAAAYVEHGRARPQVGLLDEHAFHRRQGVLPVLVGLEDGKVKRVAPRRAVQVPQRLVVGPHDGGGVIGHREPRQPNRRCPPLSQGRGGRVTGRRLRLACHRRLALEEVLPIPVVGTPDTGRQLDLRVVTGERDRSGHVRTAAGG